MRYSLSLPLLIIACLLVSPAWTSDVPPPGDTTPLQSPAVPEPAPAAVADPVATKRKEDLSDEVVAILDELGIQNDQIAALRADLATALATIAMQAEAIAALRAEYDTTKGHVQRIGECPGIKLF